MPHAQEATANRMVDQVKSFTSPMRFASQPVSGIEIALATPNEVITQVPWEFDAPRLPAIVGIATLAMVESRTCMNVASDNAMVIRTSGIPSSGFCAITASASSSGVGADDIGDQLIDRRKVNRQCVAAVSGLLTGAGG